MKYENWLGRDSGKFRHRIQFKCIHCIHILMEKEKEIQTCYIAYLQSFCGLYSIYWNRVSQNWNPYFLRIDRIKQRQIEMMMFEKYKLKKLVNALKFDECEIFQFERFGWVKSF